MVVYAHPLLPDDESKELTLDAEGWSVRHCLRYGPGFTRGVTDNGLVDRQRKMGVQSCCVHVLGRADVNS